MPNYTKRQLQIIKAAIEIIAEGGIQELTIKHLAAKIGFSEPAVYRHFKNKFEILEAILDSFGSENKHFFIETIASKKEPIEKIRDIFHYHFEVFTRQPALAAVIFSEDIFLNDEQLTKKVLSIMAQSRESFVKIISGSNALSIIRNDIVLEHLVLIVMGTLRLIVNKWHLNKHNFDLIQEGNKVWDSLQKVITKSE